MENIKYDYRQEKKRIASKQEIDEAVNQMEKRKEDKQFQDRLDALVELTRLSQEMEL